MSPPFIASLFPLEAAVSDPSVRAACLESLSRFHILHLSHTSKTESWTRQILLPRSPQVDDHGPALPSSDAGRSSRATTRAEPVGPGDQYASRRERPSPIRHMTALMFSGIKEKLGERQARHAGSRDLSWSPKGQMFAASLTQRCSGASPNNTRKKWQTASSRSQIRNWMMKGKESGRRTVHSV
jgi:hypothetical protein